MKTEVTLKIIRYGVWYDRETGIGLGNIGRYRVRGEAIRVYLVRNEKFG